MSQNMDPEYQDPDGKIAATKIFTECLSMLQTAAETADKNNKNIKGESFGFHTDFVSSLSKIQGELGKPKQNLNRIKTKIERTIETYQTSSLAAERYALDNPGTGATKIADYNFSMSTALMNTMINLQTIQEDALKNPSLSERARSSINNAANWFEKQFKDLGKALSKLVEKKPRDEANKTLLFKGPLKEVLKKMHLDKNKVPEIEPSKKSDLPKPGGKRRGEE